MSDGYKRIGQWVSGVAHLALILWALLGGVLFRPQPPHSVQIAEVATMSGAEFEAYAAASRGAGPVSPETASAPEITAPETEAGAADAPDSANTPDAEAAAQELAQPDLSETEPDLSDFQNRQPVNVATNLPVLGNAAEAEGTAPDTPSVAALPEAAAQPNRPAAPAQDQAAEAVAPRSPLALDRSAKPPIRPDDLVERRNERLAEEAAERAAAEAERLAAEEEAQRAEELAEQQRQEAERAAAAEAAQAEAERQRQEAEAQAERDRLAREEEERRLATEQDAAEQAAAERDAADRQALEDALREAQSAIPANGGGATTTETGENRQRIEGGTGASVEQDPLAAALSEALSGQGAEQAPPPAPNPNVNQFLPHPITPRPLSGVELQSATEPAPRADAPLGQPLSISEREGFRVTLAQCWNRGALSVEASRLTVSVRFRLGPDGRADPNSLELIESQAGSATAIENAFNVARRAILECGRAGFPLPREKYQHWQQVIVDFHPEGINFQ